MSTFLKKLKSVLNNMAATNRAGVIDAGDIEKHLGSNICLLEIGCGDGNLARAIRKKVPQITKYIACDIHSLVKDNHVFDSYHLFQTPDEFEAILQQEKIDVLMFAYAFHHIGDNAIIKNYLNIAKKCNKKVLVIEEIVIHPIFKPILYLNDSISNILEYRGKIQERNKYLALNFKSRKAWFNIFKSLGYTPTLLQRKRRRGYMCTESYLLTP